MHQGKAVVAVVVVGLITGCSQKTDTNDAYITNEAVAATQALDSATDDAASPVVEINASAKLQQVADHRPIKLPEIEYRQTTQSFEIGNDAPLGETSGSQHVSLRYEPVTESGPTRFAPTYPDRPVPQRGMKKQEVLAAVGSPANQMTGNGSEIWDYGTYRVFFSGDVVSFTRVW